MITLKEKNKTFIKITNADIYAEIKEIRKSISCFSDENNKQHESICKRQDLTNGKIKLSKWMATTAISIALISIGFLFQYIVL